MHTPDGQEEVAQGVLPRGHHGRNSMSLTAAYQNWRLSRLAVSVTNLHWTVQIGLDSV